MSTVDEVLATAEVVDAVCVIDGETRIITVPNEYKELGVESDEKVTRIKFQCPKIVGDNVDLTEYNLYINYRNAGNKLNSYLVEDATVTGDVINFSWLLSRHVTESPGTISYIVCAKKSDYTGVINEWNTKVATGTVGVGLEATEEIEEQNIDIIEQILRSIVELEKNVGGGGSVEDGGYYAPSVDNEGNLTWTASKTGMPAVDGANIKGSAGASGTDGKSAYAYAVEGGYTGTEGEFAAKLAEEMPTTLPNPNALTFTGGVTGSYDGSAPLSVEIPTGGEKWETILDLTLEEDVNKVVLMSGEVGYKKIVVYMKSVPPTDQTVTSNQAVSVYSGETNLSGATAKLNGAYVYNANRLSGVSIELTPYAANVFASGSSGWQDTGTPTGNGMGYSSANSLSKPIKKLTAQVWGSAKFGVGSWFKVYGVRI